MNSPITVFDFDKTLTNDDTVFGYYSLVNENKIGFSFKRVMSLIAALFYKIGFINNSKLKQLGVKLFLKGFEKEILETYAEAYAQKIELNQIYYQHFVSTPHPNRMIISASFEVYLKKIFPKEKVIGSQLDFINKRVKGLKRNMYGKAKRDYLIQNGIDEIDCLYTDSYSDLSLIKMSKKTNFVKDGLIIKTL